MSGNVKYSFERCEKKYFLTPLQQEFLLCRMSRHMSADRYGKYKICNIYYDTDDWRLIRASIEKPVYKEKLRVRSYGVPDEGGSVFVELKKKYDGVVYKRRITAEPETAARFLRGLIPGARFGQIGREIEWFCEFNRPVPKVFIGYERTAFAGIEEPELRVTFDTDLRWRGPELDLRSGDYGELIIPQDKILMEIKMPGACPLWLSEALAKAKVYPTSFSKYGTCYREHILKQNVEEIKKEAHFCA